MEDKSEESKSNANGSKSTGAIIGNSKLRTLNSRSGTRLAVGRKSIT